MHDHDQVWKAKNDVVTYGEQDDGPKKVWNTDITALTNATRNRKHRRAAAKPAACANPLML